MDDLDARLKALADPEQHAAKMAEMDILAASLKALNDPTKHAEQMARLAAINAELKAMMARAQAVPSLPELARNLAALTTEVWRLRERVGVLEAECYALRQRELLRFWADEDAEGTRPEEER